MLEADRFQYVYTNGGSPTQECAISSNQPDDRQAGCGSVRIVCPRGSHGDTLTYPPVMFLLFSMRMRYALYCEHERFIVRKTLKTPLVRRKGRAERKQQQQQCPVQSSYQLNGNKYALKRIGRPDKISEIPSFYMCFKYMLHLKHKHIP